jgi:hypothetical protein
VLLYSAPLLLAALLGVLRDSALQIKTSLGQAARKRDVKALGWCWKRQLEHCMDEWNALDREVEDLW